MIHHPVQWLTLSHADPWPSLTVLLHQSGRHFLFGPGLTPGDRLVAIRDLPWIRPDAAEALDRYALTVSWADPVACDRWLASWTPRLAALPDTWNTQPAVGWRELGATYTDPADRYVVSYLYTTSERHATSPEAAAARALDLLRDDNAGDTQWWVYDRQTHILHDLEQADFEPLTTWD